MANATEAELDLLAAKSQFEKFVIYLPSKFFNSSIFKSIYQRIRKKLRYKGIMTYDIDEYAKNLILHNNYCTSIKDNLLYIANEFEYQPNVSINNLLKNKFGNEFIERKFDDLDYPSANILYIHLYGGYYYNDKIYAKKKFDLERELLFFIAGNLGVSKITYSITNKETVITKIKSDANIQTIKNQIQFCKTHTEKNSCECVELYENNGALILFDANGDIKKLEKEIKRSLEPINSPIFNYGFYKYNPKMVAFVCKRFLFKMNKLDYTSESEDVSEMSLTVQSCFADYGLQIAFESSTITTEMVTYKLEFHNEKDLLETYFQKKKYIDSATDPFVMIRKFYDEDKSTNKSDSKNMITKYIIGLADKCEYKIKATSETNTFSKKLDNFIKTSDARLSIKYKHFYTTRDIKKWFVDNLLIRNREEVANDFFDDLDYTTNNYTTKNTDVKLENIQVLSSNPTANESANESIKKYETQIISLENQLKDTQEQLHLNQLYISKMVNSINADKIQQQQEQYFPNKDTIFSELARECLPMILAQESTIEPVNMSSNNLELSTQLITQKNSPAPSLTLSTNSLVSIATPASFNDILDDNESEKEIHSRKTSKTLTQILIENNDKMNRYKELNKMIDMMKYEITYKNSQLEKFKNANKDKMTENLIELSSSQNALQSLRSRRVMEQIKQTASNKDLKDIDEEHDAFDKLKCMFSRANATMINIDKQISKMVEKCKKLEEEIAINKNEIQKHETEIELISSKCDDYIDEKNNLENELIKLGLTANQFNNVLIQNRHQISGISDISSECSIQQTKNTNSYDDKNKTNKSNNFLSRTFSNNNKSKENITISSV